MERNENGEEMDPYDILGVPVTATEKEIRIAYKKMALLKHPDKQKNEEDRKRMHAVFARLSNAHEVLMDPVKRRAYDNRKQQQQQREQQKSKQSSSSRQGPTPGSSSSAHYGHSRQQQQQQQQREHAHHYHRQSYSHTYRQNTGSQWHGRDYSFGGSSSRAQQQQQEYQRQQRQQEYQRQHWEKEQEKKRRKQQRQREQEQQRQEQARRQQEEERQQRQRKQEEEQERQQKQQSEKRSRYHHSSSHQGRIFGTCQDGRPCLRCIHQQSYCYQHQHQDPKRTGGKGKPFESHQDEKPFRKTKTSHTHADQQKNESNRSSDSSGVVYGVRLDGEPCLRCQRKGGYCHQHEDQKPPPAVVYGVRLDGQPCLRCQQKKGYCHQHQDQQPGDYRGHKGHTQEHSHARRDQERSRTKGQRHSDPRDNRTNTSSSSSSSNRREPIYGICQNGEPCRRCLKQQRYCYQHAHQQ